MRIRTQLLAFVTASVCTGILAAAIVFAAGRREDAAGDAQARAQVTEHEVAGLLALTQEYARYAEPRAAEQWRLRHAAIAAALADDRQPGSDPALVGTARRHAGAAHAVRTPRGAAGRQRRLHGAPQGGVARPAAHQHAGDERLRLPVVPGLGGAAARGRERVQVDRVLGALRDAADAAGQRRGRAAPRAAADASPRPGRRRDPPRRHDLPPGQHDAGRVRRPLARVRRDDRRADRQRPATRPLRAAAARHHRQPARAGGLHRPRAPVPLRQREVPRMAGPRPVQHGGPPRGRGAGRADLCRNEGPPRQGAGRRARAVGAQPCAATASSATCWPNTSPTSMPTARCAAATR